VAAGGQNLLAAYTHRFWCQLSRALAACQLRDERLAATLVDGDDGGAFGCHAFFPVVACFLAWGERWMSFCSTSSSTNDFNR